MGGVTGYQRVRKVPQPDLYMTQAQNVCTSSVHHIVDFRVAIVLNAPNTFTRCNSPKGVALMTQLVTNTGLTLCFQPTLLGSKVGQWKTLGTESSLAKLVLMEKGQWI